MIHPLLKFCSPREGHPKPLLAGLHQADLFNPRGRITKPTIAKKSRHEVRTAQRHLLPGLELGGDQTDLVNARAAHDVDGMSDIHEQYRVVPLDEGHLLRPLLEDSFQERAEKVAFVKGDDSVLFMDVAHAIDIMRGAGIDKVGLITAKLEAGQ